MWLLSQSGTLEKEKTKNRTKRAARFCADFPKQCFAIRLGLDRSFQKGLQKDAMLIRVIANGLCHDANRSLIFLKGGS